MRRDVEHRKIVMAVTNDLVTDRRVDRHCRELTAAGYEVLLIGRLLPHSKEVERPYRTERMELRHLRGPKFYAEFNQRVARRIVEEKPDLVWANDSDTLPGCWWAAHRLRCRLVMDAHELFPELPEVIGRPVVRLAWRLINKCLMPRCSALITVCQSFADYYRGHNGVEMTVVRNVQPTDASLQPKAETPEHPVLLYQGAVNVGRGVDWAIDAMEFLPDCRLSIAGGGDLIEEMRRYAGSKPWADRIDFLGLLPHEELDRLTPSADVGLLMLEEMGLSYHLTLPNRVGDFVAAGVPVVASDMPETARVVKQYGVGELMDAPGPRALADATQRLLERWRTLDEAQRKALFVPAREDMDWKKEKEKLIECVNVLMRK